MKTTSVTIQVNSSKTNDWLWFNSVLKSARELNQIQNKKVSYRKEIVQLNFIAISQ